LTAILLQISIAYSQEGTVKSKIEDSLVCTTKEVAKQIVKDLYRKDSLQKELDIVKESYSLLKQNYELRDSIIHNKNSVIGVYKEREANYNSIITTKDKQISSYEEMLKNANSLLHKSKVANAFHWGATIVSFLLVTVITIL
jgi:hypothetical protein